MAFLNSRCGTTHIPLSFFDVFIHRKTDNTPKSFVNLTWIYQLISSHCGEYQDDPVWKEMYRKYTMDEKIHNGMGN